MDIVSEEDDRMTAIRQHYQADSERLTKIKALQVCVCVGVGVCVWGVAGIIVTLPCHRLVRTGR